ncbi:PREDICTED: cyclic GMP-AMP synthase [Elephantulus edwardii]|uniref:cyclic GMP-AMP synthase n=1 Tax=Elephantulus edwardii TaxID=28737 RepID=UPI0003F07826|nr:PREDICTED: cyclic GMP-AMP synthase [Elephantulus edwardii]
MDPRRGKERRTSKKAGAGTPKGSAQSARGGSEKPEAFSPASGAAISSSGRCSPAGKSVPKKSARDPQKMPPGPGAKTAPLRAGDSPPLGAPSADERERQKAPSVPPEGSEPSASAEPPLPVVRCRRPRGTGSRRGGGADPALERRSAPRPEEVGSPGRESASGWKPRQVLKNLKLSLGDISPAAEVVNRVVDHLLRRFQSSDSEFKGISVLHAGSYYERVKVSVPNEFDVMFTLKVERIQLDEYGNSGAYYFVKFKRNPKGNPLSPFLEEEILSASKMLIKFRQIIKEEIKNIGDTDIVVERKKRGSPAVTLLIRKPKEISVDIILALESKSSWPVSTQEGLAINNWLGAKVRTKLRRQPYYLIPKHAKDGRSFQEETWRLSFSHIEKYILESHGQSKTCCENGGMKCCRKDCLKLMKYLLEQLKKKFEDRKELDKFCSYHVKTAFLHLCTRDPDDSQWLPRDLALCFDNFVTYFLQCLSTQQLKHYFIPGFNLFSSDQIERVNKEFLFRQIEYERNNGFPVFWNEF